MKALTLVFLGRSGSGKDTQYRLLANRHKNHLMINTGNLFRVLATPKSLLGGKIKKLLTAGELPPGWLASYLLLKEIVEKLKEGESLFIAGAPRRLEEAKLLDEVMQFLGRRKPTAIYFEVTEKEATQRLLKRGREDDTPEAIKHRMWYFKKSVLPVVKYYQERKRLVKINGELPEEEVRQQMIIFLEKLERDSQGGR